MKQQITQAFKLIAADRGMLFSSLIVLVASIAYIVYVAISLSPSDLQLATRYTTFGETQFYRNKWYYLLSFVGFGVMFLIVHLGMIAKLLATGMRALAYALALLSLVILLIAFVYTYNVLGIAYLS